jgi:pimeloyl-ACP methyl ester carboxylesterase
MLIAVAGCPGQDCPGPKCPQQEPDLAQGGDPDLSSGEEPDLRGPAPDAATLPRPDAPGPRGQAGFDLQVPVGGGNLQVTVVGPSEDGMTLSMAGAPYPLVVLSPGLTISRGQFRGYADRLASHGVLVVLQNARSEANHTQYRDDTIKLIDWMLTPTGASAGRVQGRADRDRIGVAGHSLGGKISLLVAAADPRVKAALGIDPVDGGVGMQPTAMDAVDKIRLPAGVPLAFLGETTSKGGGMPCTPTGQNYEALYGKAPAPAFALTFVGAAHNDFVDNFAGCLTCGFCPGGTAPKTRTRDLAIKYVAAYFLWSLRDLSPYADYLSSAEMTKDIMAGYITRVSK